MRRIRLSLGHRALFACFALVALLALLPLSIGVAALGLAERGLSARAARGSLWAGRLQEARFGRLALGDVDASLSPLALLIGRARVSLSGVAGTGAVTVTRHGFGIDDATVALPAGAAFAPLPVESIAFESFSVRFRDGRCDTAEGRVHATFAGDVGGLSLGGGMSGAARCDAGALLIPLVSQSALASLTLRISGGGAYTALLNIRSADPALAAKLAPLGFAPAPGGFALRLAGTL